jgi:hypothetical protein
MRKWLAVLIGVAAAGWVSAGPIPYTTYGTVNADFVGQWPGNSVYGFYVFEYNSGTDYGADEIILRMGEGQDAVMDVQDVPYIDAFCVDETGTIGTLMNPFDFYVVSLADVPYGPEGPMGGAKAGDISKLWGFVEKYVGAVTPDFDDLDGDDSDGDTSDGFSGNEAKAMQAAIWEILYEDTGAYDVTVANDANGWKTGLVPAITGTANAWLNVVNNATLVGTDWVYGAYSFKAEPNLGALIEWNEDTQTQEFVALFDRPVPEPSTAGLMLLGLLGLAARRRR